VLLGEERLDAATLALLDHLEVRESDSDPSALALRFRMVQAPDGSFRPTDQDLFVPGKPLGVELSAPGGLLKRLFQGYVTHLRPHYETIESNCYLEVLGMDAAVLLDAEERVAAFPDATDADAATQILESYGLRVESATTVAQHAQDRQLLVQRATDWAFVKKLARRNGFQVWFEFDPDRSDVFAWFKKPDISGSPQADLVLLQEGQNLKWADVQLTAAGPMRYAAFAIDPLAKRLLSAEGDETALDLLGDADAAQSVEDGLTAAGATGAVGLLRDPVPLDEALNAEAVAATDRARFVLELRGELDPALYRGLLRARKPVLVRGLGQRYSGVYYVQTVRTTLSEGVLSQSFVAVRNATGQAGSERFGQSAEEVPAA
jgi:hypothetical protein